MPTDVQDAIIKAAREHGIDPATALAIAERESDFNVNGKAKGSSAHGLFQLLKREREKYGGSSTDPHEQSKAGMSYLKDLKQEMSKYLGREPTGTETYAGHFWGGSRGARLATGKIPPETPVSEIFTPQELAANPNIVRAGTAGKLTSSVFADIDKRTSKFAPMLGGDSSSSIQEAGEIPDFSKYGSLADDNTPQHENTEVQPVFAEQHSQARKRALQNALVPPKAGEKFDDWVDPSSRGWKNPSEGQRPGAITPETLLGLTHPEISLPTTPSDVPGVKPHQLDVELPFKTPVLSPKGWDANQPEEIPISGRATISPEGNNIQPPNQIMRRQGYPDRRAEMPDLQNITPSAPSYNWLG